MYVIEGGMNLGLAHNPRGLLALACYGAELITAR